ncbi:MAG: hypothetical protein LBP62_04560 [Clostridiales bacterium]|jgi:hypothetical protein|nr:hypothetical protein [Clostridiales bacterium]
MSKKMRIITVSVAFVLIAAVGLFAAYNLFLLADVYAPMNLKADPAAAFYSESRGAASLSNGYISLVYDTAKGRYNVSYNGKAITTGAYSQAEIKTADGKKTLFKSKDCPLLRVYSFDVSDGFGTGKGLTAVRTLSPSMTMSQNFYIYDGAESLITDIKIDSPDEIATNDMRQILSEKHGGAKTVLGNMKKLSFLETPFDNDSYEDFSPRPLTFRGDMLGYGVSMIFSESEKEALVAGALDNSIFKNALAASGGANSLTRKISFDGLYMHFGKLSKESRDYNNKDADSIEHGYITGKSLASPRMFYGFFCDYRDGLESFGDAAGIAEPMLKWEGKVPVGYNSWAALAFDMNYGTMTGMSDYIKQNLPSYGGGADVYVNFDSGFDGLDREERAAFPAYAKANGQKAGVYFNPFTVWGTASLDQDLTDYSGNPITDDSGNTLKNRDIVLRNKDGVLISIGDRYSVDATNPFALKKIDSFLETILDWGYQYVKLDFINDGAMEGEHYDKTAGPTGIAAFNYGLKHIREYTENYVRENDRDPFFINAAISPVFSGMNIHSRRISCDVFAKINHTFYLLNSLSYGWWMNGRIISVSDPDHLVMYRYYDEKTPPYATENEAKAAVVSRVIGGSLLMWSDNIAYPESKERAETFLENGELMEIAAKNKAFRPLYAGRASKVFYLLDGETLYVALFNPNQTVSVPFLLNLSEFGFDASSVFVKDILSGETKTSDAPFSVTAPPASGTILKITKTAA